MKRRVLCSLVLTVLAATVAPPAHAAPARSGTIIGGYFPFAPLLAPGPGPDCKWNVDCLPWVEAGCPARMAGIDPAVHSSIVDVGRLAGSRKIRKFMLRFVPELMWGGVSIQFWTKNCVEIAQIGGDRGRGSWKDGIKGAIRFSVPKRAKWMTVASMDTTTIEWRLT